MAVSVPAGMRQMTSTTCIDCGRLFPVGAGLHLGAVKYAIGTSSAFDELDVVDVDESTSSRGCTHVLELTTRNNGRGKGDGGKCTSI